ncbi:CoA transferase [Ramlibacter sp. AN1015]|uniref:CaiB/BaiF CoA transferase family protein n=1 Tax=Ramlibacter sp. AN1015 TaxID=3133428 RepID=UPI0030C31E76
MNRSPSALTGMRVLDLSRVLAGPLCAQMLADHGAEVIKVESLAGDETRKLGPPFTPAGPSAYFAALNRGKRSVRLDFNDEGQREALVGLMASADLLIENFLPGTMERWGLGYEQICDRHPGLIYCSVTGFGEDGPLGGLPGYDAILQAMSGLMSLTGNQDSGPLKVGVPVVDILTAHNAMIGVLLARVEQLRSGRGQKVEVSLYDSALSMLVPQASNWLHSGVEPRQMGNGHPNIYPYDLFRVSNGEIYIGILNDAQFARFCNELRVPELAADERFKSNPQRLANRQALRAEIERAVGASPSQALCERLMKVGVPAAPVLSVSAALNHPHTAHREMVVRDGDYQGLGVPVKLSLTPGRPAAPPSDMGAELPRFAPAR